MDARDVLIDGIEQLHDWFDDALKDLSTEQVNWLADGKTLSCGFQAWHIFRTSDNITNFVFQRKQPIWLEGGYCDRFGLPKVEQGTGMGLEDARGLKISDPSLLREYGRKVGEAVIGYLRTVPNETLMEVQQIRPLGEMPKWRVFRQVMMTHGFMHLGEINTLKGMMGLSFFL